jgi:hypothetical protein
MKKKREEGPPLKPPQKDIMRWGNHGHTHGLYEDCHFTHKSDMSFHKIMQIPIPGL